MVKKLILFVLCATVQSLLWAQTVRVVVSGLRPGDSCQVTIQQNEEYFFIKSVLAGPDSSGQALFEGIAKGVWQLKTHTIGYLHPPAQIIQVKEMGTAVRIEVKWLQNNRYEYEWQDDSSYVGHAMMSYINQAREVVVLNDTIEVPTDFSSHNLLSQFGVLLSNEGGRTWSEEEAYRLFNTMKRLPENNYQCWLCTGNKPVKSVWTLTGDELYKDIEVTVRNDIQYVKVSKSAFTYSSPIVVLFEGVRGTFYSKRLFQAVLNVVTDFGRDDNMVQHIARQKYGFEFLVPGAQLETLMRETQSNFQAFFTDEKIQILSMIEELPDGFHRQAGLKFMVRRINGQDHPKYTEAAAIAWTGSNTIEFMEKAFKGQNLHSIQRLILHEKAHFLWEFTFDNTLKNDWTQLGGWFMDPAAASGWSTVLTTEFVSAYAHAKNPNEDMAESIATYVTNPDLLRSRSYRKFEFIRDRVMHGTQYLARIREDLTFQVYNLFPDYNYPGKIKRIKTNVTGNPTEDKILSIEIELETFGNSSNGANTASLRLVSEISTFRDMWLSPVNQQKSILRGQIAVSKYAASGYWRVNQIRLIDEVGNERFENNNHFGLLCFVNNPLEDFKAPWYVHRSLSMKDTLARFTNPGWGVPDPRGELMQALKIHWKMEEKTIVNRVITRFFPERTDSPNAQVYSRDVQIPAQNITNNTLEQGIKEATVLIPIPDYYPSGYYTLSNLVMDDVAGNIRWVFLDKDTKNQKFHDPDNLNTGYQRDLRDSVYIQTKYPDYLPPILDVNRIRIKATPTNPQAPDGETVFEIWILAKDTSHHQGFAAGYMGGNFTLGDPQGKETIHHYTLGFHEEYYKLDRPAKPEEFKEYYAKVLLPRGSAPGTWGVSEIVISDKTLNSKKYSFVEYIRFDLLDAPIARAPQLWFSENQVNVNNTGGLKTSILCNDCKGLSYQLSLYSSGGGKIVKYSGKINEDTTVLQNLNLAGIEDGVLYGSVLILDSLRRQVGSNFSTTFFDLSVPKGFTGKLPLYYFGAHRLDGITYLVKTEESKGDYRIRMIPLNQPKDSLVVFGSFSQNEFSVPNLSFRNLPDGIVRAELIIIDSAGNVGTPFTHLFVKDTYAPQFSYKTLKVDDANHSLQETIQLSFSEPIETALNLSDFSILNGALENVSRLNDSTYWITLDTRCAPQTRISLSAKRVKDLSGNISGSDVLLQVDRPYLQNQILDISGPLERCANDSTAYPLLSLNATEGYTYQWLKDGQILNNPQGPSFEPRQSGSYSVRIRYRNVCTVGTDTVKVTVHPAPEIPLLKWVDTAITALNSPLNNWRIDGTLLAVNHPGALLIRKNGSYQAQSVSSKGCKSNWSLPVEVVLTSIAPSDKKDHSITLYPNPTQSEIRLTADFSLSGSYYEIWSMGGQKITDGTLPDSHSVMVQHVPAGPYLIRIKNGFSSYLARFVKVDN